MIDWLTRTEFLHNPLRLWLYAAATALIGYLLVHGSLHYLANRLRKRHARFPDAPRSAVLVLLEATHSWLIFLLALALSAALLHFTSLINAILGHVGFALIGLQIALWANALIDLWLHRSPAQAGDVPTNPVLVGMLVWAAQLVVWVVVLLAFLSNVGVNVTTFVASLGIGGVAVALALQNVLGDLFASIAIGLDKPFEVGQFIAFGDALGTVRHVGVKSTRIDSLSGEQLVISNSNLLKELVHNYSRMTQRRIVFGFRVPYDTSAAAARQIVESTRSFIETAGQTRFDRGHLTEFGEFGLEFEFVYYILSAEFSVYRDIQQRINFKIMDLLGELRLRFAVPARMLHTADKTISDIASHG